MEPNNLNPYQQPHDPAAQPVVQPQQPQTVVGASPYNAQPMPSSQPQQPVQPQYSQPQNSPPYGPPKSGKKGLMIAIIIGVVVILVIGGLAFALLGKKNTSNSSTSNSSSSSAGSTSSATTTKTACELFSQSDAQAVVGSTAKAVATSAHQTQIPNTTSSGCSYIALPNTLVIGVISGGSSSSVFSSVVSNFSQLNGSTPTPVSGLGDQATYFSNGTLVVQKGNVVFDIFLSESNPVTQSEVEQVATTMLGNF